MSEEQKVRWANPEPPIHHISALWAAACAERALPIFEEPLSGDTRPHAAIEALRASERGDLPMTVCRTCSSCRRPRYRARLAAEKRGRRVRPICFPKGVTGERPPGRGILEAHESGGVSELAYRQGAAAAVALCVLLWVEACAVRDSRAVSGVADRARPKFDHAESWVVGERRGVGVVGFVLATVAGSGLLWDPPNAPVIGLLAVTPNAHGWGVRASLLSIVAMDLTRGGHARAILHVLADNHPAVRLYAGQGWQALGQPSQHSC